MNSSVRDLLIVLAYFMGALLFLFICLKVYMMVHERKSRQYRSMSPGGQGAVQTVGDRLVVDAAPIQPHYFARGYKYRTPEYERAKCERQSKLLESAPATANTLRRESEAEALTTSV